MQFILSLLLTCVKLTMSCAVIVYSPYLRVNLLLTDVLFVLVLYRELPNRTKCLILWWDNKLLYIMLISNVLLRVKGCCRYDSWPVLSNYIYQISTLSFQIFKNNFSIFLVFPRWREDGEKRNTRACDYAIAFAFWSAYYITFREWKRFPSVAPLIVISN